MPHHTMDVPLYYESYAKPPRYTLSLQHSRTPVSTCTGGGTGGYWWHLWLRDLKAGLRMDASRLTANSYCFSLLLLLDRKDAQPYLIG